MKTKKPYALSVGDNVVHAEYGEGVVRQIDAADSSLNYFFTFKDGTKLWLSKRDGERKCKPFTPAADPV